MHEIELDGSEQKICRECIDDFSMGGKFEKLKMIQDSTVYRMYELEEDEEEVEGQWISMEVTRSIMCLFYILVGR